MAIRHTAVSYYGLNYTEHAEKDFIEMKDHGCDTVILAITEFDMDFWLPNINNIVRTAHKVGLRCIADTWGIGKYFGGEQVSLFLQNNIHHRQVSAYTGEILNAACFNTRSFRDYFGGLCLKLARETEIDGFFWDEPHYAYPKSYASITGGAGDDWSCRCPECMKKFEEYYGYEMPRFMNDDVKQFRWREALITLSDCSKALKEVNPGLEITCCVHATKSSYYVTELRGYDNWDMVDTCPYSAKRIYVDAWLAAGKPEFCWPYSKVCINPPLTEEKLLTGIRETVFGKCVFDNEILYHVDNQFVQMYFKNGVKASLKMVYGNEPGRRLAFYGTYGEIIMDERTDEIEVMVFGKEKEIISINSLTEDGNAHGGGDGALMAELYPILIGEQKSRTPLKESIESHLMGIAAEESRKNGGVLVKVHGQTE